MTSFKPIEKIYHLLVASKNYMYERKFFKVKKLSVPVISVGNLSFGGVGKTPCIIFLAEELSKTKKVNIVTKSYKASLKEPAPVNLDIDRAAALYGDEACLIQARLPQCRVWSGPIKYQTALASLIERPDVVLLDDGFSHRKLHRNFDLILIDATLGFEDYQREPISSLVRSSAVIITKVNLSDEQSVNKIKECVSIYLPQLKNKTYLARAKTVLNFSKENLVWVFCGLAHPQSLIDDLKIQGYQIAHQQFYPDHYAYSEAEQLRILTNFRRALKSNDKLKLVCTQKDFVKLTNEELKTYVNLTEHSFEMPTDQKEDLLAKIRKSF
jgi:tetraacyldisaccharide 4'-kinase